GGRRRPVSVVGGSRQAPREARAGCSKTVSVPRATAVPFRGIALCLQRFGCRLIAATGAHQVSFSDPRIPGVTTLGVGRAFSTAKRLQRVRDHETVDVLGALVTQLPRYSHAQGTAEWYGKVAAVHAPRDERLRVFRLVEVDAVPGVVVVRLVDHVPRVRADGDDLEHGGEGRPDPLSDVRPALLAAEF